MAFVSIIKLKTKSSGRSPGTPFIRFFLSKSRGSGYLSIPVPLRSKKIEVQIDYALKRIRITESDEGIKVNKAGMFSCSANVPKVVGEKRVELELSEDGWWYGSYADNGSQ